MARQYIKGKVSVIIPIYNAERYLSRTLESVFSQTYKNIEIILVDDCSKDNSVHIINDYKQQHSEIKYFLQPKNMGAGAARNKCLEIATGQYVAFLDSDDLWVPEKIQHQLSLMKKKESPMSYTAIEMIDENDEMIKKHRKLRTSCDYQYLLRNTIIATSSVVVDRNALGDFRMPLRRGGQDYATWLMLLRGGAVACGINKPLTRYRVNRHSLSSNKFKSIKQVWEIQTQDEKINKCLVILHVLCFVFNAFRKYFM